MKKLTQKLPKSLQNEKGIAIIFSLTMLMVFFFLSFGFLSLTTSASAAAKARVPKQTADLVVTNNLLEQALIALEDEEYGLLGGLTAPDPNRLLEVDFVSGTLTANFHAWGTKAASGTSNDIDDPADLEDYLELQLLSSSDYKPSTSDSDFTGNFGWVKNHLDIDGNGENDDFAWMAILSDGLDPNYIGGKTAAQGGDVTGVRDGIYAREIDMKHISNSYNDNGTNTTGILYIDWEGNDTPHLSKSSMETKQPATSEWVNYFEVGTSPVPIYKSDKAPDGSTDKFDLNSLETGSTNDAAQVSTITDGISWLGSNTGADQLAANINDFIDRDSEMTTDWTNGNNGTFFGNERVPYINQFLVQVENLTEEPSGSPPSTEPTEVKVTFSTQLLDMYSIDKTGHTDYELEVEYKIEVTRGDDGPFEETRTLTSSSGVAMNTLSWSGGFATNMTPIYETFEIMGGDSSETSTISDVKVTITDITLRGQGDNDTAVTLKDVVRVPATGVASIPTTIEKGTLASCSEPRMNEKDTNWEFGSFDAGISLTSSSNASYSPGGANTTILQVDTENTGSTPSQISTAYMPEDGGIDSLLELGFIHRGKEYQTINLTEYNVVAPTTFNINNFAATAPCLANVSTTFNGGDRSLLSYVKIDNSNAKPGLDKPITGYTSYDQYGVVNPNSSHPEVISAVLADIKVDHGPYETDGTGANAGKDITGTVINPADNSYVEDFVDNYWPMMREMTLATSDSAVQDRLFNCEDFISDSDHNPPALGYPFSSLNASGNANDLPDTAREAMVYKSMNLFSPMYSYYTILGVVKLNSTTTYSKIAAFVRRNNENGQYVVIRKIVE